MGLGIELDRAETDVRQRCETQPGFAAIYATVRSFMRGQPDGTATIHECRIDHRHRLRTSGRRPALSTVHGCHYSAPAYGYQCASICMQADQVRDTGTNSAP